MWVNVIVIIFSRLSSERHKNNWHIVFRRQQLQAQQQQQQRQQQQQQLEALPGRSQKTPKTHSLEIPGVGRIVGGKKTLSEILACSKNRLKPELWDKFNKCNKIMNWG